MRVLSAFFSSFFLLRSHPHPEGSGDFKGVEFVHYIRRGLVGVRFMQSERVAAGELVRYVIANLVYFYTLVG